MQADDVQSRQAGFVRYCLNDKEGREFPMDAVTKVEIINEGRQ